MNNNIFFRDPELVEFWEPKKEYIEKDLWVIRDFLTEEELAWLTKESNDPEGWYDTMRSPYGGNVKNKFLGTIPRYTEEGQLIPPHPDQPDFHSQFIDCPLLRNPGGIESKLASVLPDYFAGAGALQSFFEVPDEIIIKELGHNVDYAMNWHYERDDSDPEDVQKPFSEQGMLTASFNVYINDNFDGGILEFKNKDYNIKPEPGMLVNIPLYKEFEHRITKVTNGNRHTLYGRCWDSIDRMHHSSIDDC